MSVDDASRLVEAYGFGEVLIEPTGQSLEDVLDIAFAFLDARVDVRVVSSRFEIVVGRSAIGALDGVPVLRFRRFDLAGPEVAVKRLVDVIGAVLGLLILSPLLAAIAIAIRATSRGPVLFRQERVGQGGRAFRCSSSAPWSTERSGHQDYSVSTWTVARARREVAADGTRIYKLTRDPRDALCVRGHSPGRAPQLWN
jgi:hypothetical protein